MNKFIIVVLFLSACNIPFAPTVNVSVGGETKCSCSCDIDDDAHNRQLSRAR